jgi:hypothetical protein
MTAGVLMDEGYTLTDFSVPRWLYWLLTAQVGRIDKLLSYPRAAGILVETKDELKGGITRRGGIQKRLTQADRHKLNHGTQRAKKILINAGASACAAAGCSPCSPAAPCRSADSSILICRPRSTTSMCVMHRSFPIRGACRRR